MLPRILTSDMAESERRRWKIVRRDFMTELSGLVLEANSLTGHAVMRQPDFGVGTTPGHKDVVYDLGAGGMAIMYR